MKRLWLFVGIISLILLSIVVGSGARIIAQGATGVTTRVSVSTAGVEGNGDATNASISADGRYVAFQSRASNLVANDTNDLQDIFVHDRQTGQTTRVSVSSSGQEGNDDAFHASISADGRYIAFFSSASNLVPNDTNAGGDVFVHDRQTGQTSRVSISTSGDEANAGSGSPAISADGRFVAFSSIADNLVPGVYNLQSNVFVHDRQTGETTHVSARNPGVPGNDNSQDPTISGDGRYVAFGSRANNLIAGDRNGNWDIFVHDRSTGHTILVSSSSSGEQGKSRSDAPAISADGRHVAFESYANNLAPGDGNFRPDIFVHSRTLDTGPTPVVTGFDPPAGSAGAMVAINGENFTGATDVAFNGSSAIAFTVISDTQIMAVVPTRTTTGPITVTTPGGTALSGPDFMALVNPPESTGLMRASISHKGTEAEGDAYESAISSDGRYIAFTSLADNLVPDDTNKTDHPNSGQDIFVHDRQTRKTTRVSVSSSGVEGNGNSGADVAGALGHSASDGRNLSISADGRYIAFMSMAGNLVPGDTNKCFTLMEGEFNCPDIFVHDQETGQTTRVSVNSSGQQGNDFSEQPAISADGRYVAFASWATNLVPGDTNTCPQDPIAENCVDIYVHDRQTGQTTRVSVSSSGAQGNSLSYAPSISADGRYVAFESFASTLVPGDTNNAADVFVRDRQTGQTTRVSLSSTGIQGNNHSVNAAISANGRYVTFLSIANNLVPGDTNNAGDVFVHDRQTGQTTRVSVNSSGGQANDGPGAWPDISADGRYVAFESFASNLVPGDTNGETDLFVHDRQTGKTQRVSVTETGAQIEGIESYIGDFSFSGNGRYVSFDTGYALVSEDGNGLFDVYVYDRLPNPFIAGFNPASGLAGAPVTITGVNFTGATAVVINGTEAAFTVVSDTEITFSVPAEATTGKIVVISGDGAGSSEKNFIVLQPATPTPTITATPAISATPTMTPTPTSTPQTPVPPAGDIYIPIVSQP